MDFFFWGILCCTFLFKKILSIFAHQQTLQWRTASENKRKNTLCAFPNADSVKALFLGEIFMSRFSKSRHSERQQSKCCRSTDYWSTSWTNNQLCELVVFTILAVHKALRSIWLKIIYRISQKEEKRLQRPLKWCSNVTCSLSDLAVEVTSTSSYRPSCMSILSLCLTSLSSNVQKFSAALGPAARPWIYSLEWLSVCRNWNGTWKGARCQTLPRSMKRTPYLERRQKEAGREPQQRTNTTLLISYKSELSWKDNM